MVIRIFENRLHDQFNGFYSVYSMITLFFKKLGNSRRKKQPKMHIRKIKSKKVNELNMLLETNEKIKRLFWSNSEMRWHYFVKSSPYFFAISSIFGRLFCAPKVVHRSQKQPLLPPVKMFFVNGRRWIRYSSKFQKNFNDWILQICQLPFI